MRNFPKQIEADLLFRGVDVHDWHRGLLSSRRLCALVEALPDDSAYARERRDGDWSFSQYIDVAVVNELRLMRADNAAIHASHKMKLNLVESPMEQQVQVEMDERVSELRRHVLEKLNSGG